MAKKIAFNVVFATGLLIPNNEARLKIIHHIQKCISADEESEFPSSELNTHGPTVIGWRSHSDNTITPKEIVLRFHKPAVICRIQVLAHQYMIRKWPKW